MALSGKMTVKFDNEKIKEVLGYNTKTFENGMIRLEEFVVPFWDQVTVTKIGHASVNRNTAEKIINRLKEICLSPREVMLGWVNYGWSIKEDLKDNIVLVDFDKIVYEEI